MKAHVVSVALPPERMFDMLPEVYTLGAYPAEDRQEVLDRHRRFADETAERLIGVGVPATSAVLVGDAAHQIISAAQRSGADLIVTGSRGLRGLDRLFLGSVARNVLLHAPCSVLVVRPTTT
jgi:nucleotide-binding universal stress UspA family protein